MNVRRATEDDQATLRELWQEFVTEIPEPGGFEEETWEAEWADQLVDIQGGAVMLAEDDQGVVGVARSAPPRQGRTHLHLVYVRPRARREGVAKALLLACVRDARERGSRLVSLDVASTNEGAIAVWRRLGFTEYAKAMSTPLDALEERLGETPAGEARATTHVQSDDRVSVERAVAQFMPRLEAPEITSRESWIRVVDRVFDRDREAHGRFARELSERLGAVTVALGLEGAVVRFRLYERGRMVDEYLSVPTYYGEISKGDELALAANPTLVARLTGADRDEVRRVARTAETPADLPPAADLYAQLAQLMGLEA